MQYSVCITQMPLLYIETASRGVGIDYILLPVGLFENVDILVFPYNRSAECRQQFINRRERSGEFAQFFSPSKPSVSPLINAMAASGEPRCGVATKTI